MSVQRLDKVVSSIFTLTRSESRTAVRRGRVAVDGKIVRAADLKIDTDVNIVSLDGSTLEYKKNVYLVMNKPKGVLSASRDKKVQTVIDLLDNKYRARDVFCVGRLDKDTTGLLLITDDGHFSYRLMSPNKKVFKTYEVLLDGEIPQSAVSMFEKGIVLADGTECKPAKIEIVGKCTARVSICEGKYHQIKRMFGVIGLGVVELKRLSVAGLVLPDDLGEGEARELTSQELELLMKI